MRRIIFEMELGVKVVVLMPGGSKFLFSTVKEAVLKDFEGSLVERRIAFVGVKVEYDEFAFLQKFLNLFLYVFGKFLLLNELIEL